MLGREQLTDFAQNHSFIWNNAIYLHKQTCHQLKVIVTFIILWVKNDSYNLDRCCQEYGTPVVVLS